MRTAGSYCRSIGLRARGRLAASAENRSGPGRTGLTESEIRSLLRAAGLRGTASRIRVLERLSSATAPVSHSELADALVPMGFDRATIYRNLTDLTEVGLATRVDHGDHVWRFEFRPPDAADRHDHLHFVCTDCGTVSCVPDLEVKITARAGTRGASVGRVSEVVLRGLCDDCG